MLRLQKATLSFLKTLFKNLIGMVRYLIHSEPLMEQIIHGSIKWFHFVSSKSLDTTVRSCAELESFKVVRFCRLTRITSRELITSQPLPAVAWSPCTRCNINSLSEVTIIQLQLISCGRTFALGVTDNVWLSTFHSILWIAAEVVRCTASVKDLTSRGTCKSGECMKHF